MDMGAEETRNTDPALQWFTKKGSHHVSFPSVGEQRLQAPPQPLHLRDPPSFLNLPPSDRSQTEMTGGQPFTSPLSKGSWNHPFPEERQPQGLLPSLGAAVDQVLIPEKAPGLTEDHKGFRAEPCICICSLYKTEAASPSAATTINKSQIHRNTETNSTREPDWTTRGLPDDWEGGWEWGQLSFLTADLPETQNYCFRALKPHTAPPAPRRLCYSYSL